jgi:hypothetical protein
VDKYWISFRKIVKIAHAKGHIFFVSSVVILSLPICLVTNGEGGEYVARRDRNKSKIPQRSL